MRGWNNMYLAWADGVKSRLSFPRVHMFWRKLYSPILPSAITAVSEMSGGCLSLWCKSEQPHSSNVQIAERGHSNVWGQAECLKTILDRCALGTYFSAGPWEWPEKVSLWWFSTIISATCLFFEQSFHKHNDSRLGKNKWPWEQAINPWIWGSH